MKRLLPICMLCILLFAQIACAAERTRLIIMADMGNEPDEEQQMMHMLMYSNMFDTSVHSFRRAKPAQQDEE